MKKIISLICVMTMLVLVASFGASAYTISEDAGADKTTAEFYVYGYLGDVDLSENVNIKDATNIQKHCANILCFKDTNLILADTDLSGNVNIKDSTLIQKSLVGFAAESKVNHLISADSAEFEHVHAYKWDTTPATCTKEGATVYTCECGETYETTIGLAEHDYQLILATYYIDENGEYKVSRYSSCGNYGCWSKPIDEVETLFENTGVHMMVASDILSVSQMEYDSADVIFNWEATPFKICELAAEKYQYELDESYTYKIKVSDLNEYTLYTFGRTIDWTKIKGIPYDSKTDTVAYKVSFGQGGGDSYFPMYYKYVDQGIVEFAIYKSYGGGESPAAVNVGTLTLKSTDTGFTPLSFVLKEEYKEY